MVIPSVSEVTLMIESDHITAETDARMLNRIRNRPFQGVTVEELGALLRAADERDALKRSTLSEWVAD